MSQCLHELSKATWLLSLWIKFRIKLRKTAINKIKSVEICLTSCGGFFSKNSGKNKEFKEQIAYVTLITLSNSSYQWPGVYHLFRIFSF